MLRVSRLSDPTPTGRLLRVSPLLEPRLIRPRCGCGMLAPMNLTVSAAPAFSGDRGLRPKRDEPPASGQSTMLVIGSRKPMGRASAIAKLSSDRRALGASRPFRRHRL